MENYAVVHSGMLVNPRRACVRVTVVVLCVCACVCVSVYPSVPALAASASVEISKQRYSRAFLGGFCTLVLFISKVVRVVRVVRCVLMCFSTTPCARTV